ncbi:MAG: hypothetical protein ABIS01_08990, partial [Ferruginibacter sp.]
MKKNYAFAQKNVCMPEVCFKSILPAKNIFLKRLSLFFVCFTLLTGLQNKLFADVTLTTSPVAAGDFNQGTNNNIIYTAQMTVTTPAVAVNNIQFTLGGTHDADDIATVSVYFNASSPAFARSTLLGSAPATFAAPHTY